MEKIEKVKFSVVEPSRSFIPEYSENLNSTSYVRWGQDNKFPAFINMIYNESATVRAIIDGTVNYVAGNGVELGEGGSRWEQEINRRGDTFNDLIVSVATDILKFNGFAIQVIFNKLGTPVEFYALDFARIRLSADGQKVYYGKKWSSYSEKYEEYDAFNLERINPEKMTQIYVWRDASSRTVYPMPFWRGSWRDALGEIAASKYVLNSLSNGLAVKTLITIPNKTGMLTDDDKQKMNEAIKTRFCGPDADSSFFLYFQEEGEDALKVDAIQSKEEPEKFNSIKKSARENIFVSFRATPQLFGLPQDANKGFSKTEFVEAFQLYQRTQVRPIQLKIERAIKKITGFDINILPFALEDSEDEQQ